MTEFTEWRSLVDGVRIIAIPDSAVEQFDFSDSGSITISNGDITAIESQISDTTLTGTFSDYVENEINGRNVGLADGNANELDGTFDDLSPPYTIISVFEILDNSNQGTFIGNDGSNRMEARWLDSDGGWGLRGDSSKATSGNNEQNEVFIISTIWLSGNIELYENGGQQSITAGDAASETLQGLRLGANSASEEHGNAHHCEHVVYNTELDSETRQEEESRLSSKWGVSLE